MACRPILAVRGCLAPGLVALMLAGPALALDRPATEEALVQTIRNSIETRDYATLDHLVFWKGAGEIKKRIVRFELNRSLGRPIRSIEILPFPEHGLDGLVATGKLAPNMDVSHKVKVVFDEPAIDGKGTRPSSVFLVGKRDGAFRIGLVNRAMIDDDDD